MSDNSTSAISVFSDRLGRRYRHILAMDATRYGNSMTQYPEEAMLRELNKAYCAFYSKHSDAVMVATGNWGCGAFNGNHRLKGNNHRLKHKIPFCYWCNISVYDGWVRLCILSNMKSMSNPQKVQLSDLIV